MENFRWRDLLLQGAFSPPIKNPETRTSRFAATSRPARPGSRQSWRGRSPCAHRARPCHRHCRAGAAHRPTGPDVRKSQCGTEAGHEVRPQAMEGDGTGLGRIVEEHVVVTGKEVGGDPTITGDDLPVAGQDGRAVLQRDAGQGFGRRGAADAEIILVAAQGADGVPFLRGDPAHTQAGQAVCLGEHAHGKGPFVDVAKGRGHGIRRFQAPVDLSRWDCWACSAPADASWA